MNDTQTGMTHILDILWDGNPDCGEAARLLDEQGHPVAAALCRGVGGLAAMTAVAMPSLPDQGISHFNLTSGDGVELARCHVFPGADGRIRVLYTLMNGTGDPSVNTVLEWMAESWVRRNILGGQV